MSAMSSTEARHERAMRGHRQSGRRRADERVRALAHPVGGAVHRRRRAAGPVVPGAVPGAGAHGSGAGEPAGRAADLGDDHPHADEDRLRRAASGEVALEGHRRHAVRQLGGEAVFDGAAGLDVHPPSVRALLAGGTARQLRRRADPAGRRTVHRDGVRVEPADRRRPVFHAVAGGAQRRHHDRSPSRPSSACCSGCRRSWCRGTRCSPRWCCTSSSR